MKLMFFALFLLAAMVATAGALPTTQAVTGNTSREAWFHATGAGTVGWFEWGGITGGPYYWSTPNQTPAAGVMLDCQYGPPMLTGTVYYVRACDNTGCGAQVSWYVPAATGINQSHYGDSLLTTMRYGFNTTSLVPAITKPYTGTMTAAIAWGMLFFFIFTGMWLRPKDIFLPCILAMVAAGAIWFGPGAIGIPPEWSAIGQGLMYAAVAGIVFSWFTH